MSQELFYTNPNVYDLMDDAERAACDEYAEGYKKYLSDARIEREAVREAIKLAEARGFRPFEQGKQYRPGDKIYYDNRGKSLFLAVIGERPVGEGINLAAAHIDSPRLDLKQIPLYEDSGIAMFKTHYYGGVKKYQWVTIPLELHGRVCRKDGSFVDVCIGREAGEPRFCISDLLPHLASEQMKKPLSESFAGEDLNIIIGSRPDEEKDGDRVKRAILKLLNEKYGIIEEDFLSAELMVVPAFDVVDIGFDRALIGGYGHDDRVCAYAELMAILGVEKPVKTAVCLLVDKEEVGSPGVTGMQSRAFDRFMDSLCGGARLYDCYANSFCLSADVCNAFDPNYASVSEKRNAAMLNHGLGIVKFTGSRGKSGASDASAEVVSRVRTMFAEAGVAWQLAELGKVDAGGGGTVAMFTAVRDIDTIDAGVPVISMHAPFEIIAKADAYMTYKGMKALYESR